MIFIHQVMMFKLVTTSIKQIHWSVHFTRHFCSSDLDYDSILSMVVKFQLCVPLFSKSTECNCQIFTGFYAYTKVKTMQWVFLVSVFRNFDREILRI